MQLCYTVFSFPGPASRCSCHYSAGVPTCGCVTFPKQTNCTAGTPWYTIHDVPSQATWGLGTGHLVTRLATQLAQEAFLRIHAPCLCRGGKALVRLTFASFTQRMVPRCFRGVKLYWFLEFGPWWSDVGPNPSTMSRSFFKGIPDDRIGMGSLVAHAGALDEMPKRGCPAFKSRPAFTNSSLDVDHPTIRLLQATILKEFAAGNAPSDWKYGPGMYRVYARRVFTCKSARDHSVVTCWNDVGMAKSSAKELYPPELRSGQAWSSCMALILKCSPSQFQFWHVLTLPETNFSSGLLYIP